MRKIEHFLVLTWLLTMGLVATAFVVIADSGLLQSLLDTDRSHVSVILMLMYAIGCLHSLRRTWVLSVELERVTSAERLLAADPAALRLDEAGLALAGGARVPPGVLTDYVRDVVRAQSRESAGQAEASSASSDLLEACVGRLRGAHEFGWFMIDLMLKVGFLGTLIGFIWMLSSVSEHPTIDATSMQQILRDMSHGMSIALNTTLVSLVTATLLSAPYYLLARGLDELIECVVRLTQVEILPRLPRVAGGDRA